MRQTRTTSRKLGIELEGWAVRYDGKKILPVEIGPLLPALLRSNGMPVPGSIFRESGHGSIEFAGHPASSVETAVDHILQMHRRVTEDGLTIRFTCRSPYHDSVQARTLQTEKSRFKAIVEASKLETARINAGPDDWRVLLEQNYFAATHLHLSFPGMRITADDVDHRLLFAANVLNNVGPRVARIICDKYGIDNAGHLKIFSSWAAPERFPYYNLWFRSFDDLRTQLGAITRFIYCVDGDKENGDWAPDLRTPLQWGVHDVAELGLWHLCRIRTAYETLETRILPAVPLELLAPVTRDLDEFITFLVSIAEQGDCEVAGFGDFQEKPVWQEIAAFPIGGVKTIPARYSRENWTSDFLH
jgi:hypothetical protein